MTLATVKRVIQYMAGTDKVTSRRTPLLRLRETDATKKHAAWHELQLHPNFKHDWQLTEEEKKDPSTEAVLGQVKA